MTPELTATPEVAASLVLGRWYEAWNAHDADAIVALLTEDAAYEDPLSQSAAVLRGRAAVKQYVESGLRTFPDLRLENLEEWVSEGGAVIASYFRFSATMTGPGEELGLAPTNGGVEFYGMDRSEISGLLIARHQIFYDTTEVARQIGLAPARGSRGERIGAAMQRLAARRLRKQNRV